MEKFTNRNIQNNELEQEQFSLQDRIQNIHNFENEDTARDQEIAIVASMIGRIPTLERQNSDSQDFHDISVWTLQEMLRVSYELGKLSQEAPAPTEFQIGDKPKLKAFENFDYYWGDMIQPNFEVFYRPNPNQTLCYCLQFNNPALVQELYHQMNDAPDEEFSRLMSRLRQEELTVLSREILTEE